MSSARPESTSTFCFEAFGGFRFFTFGFGFGFAFAFALGFFFAALRTARFAITHELNHKERFMEMARAADATEGGYAFLNEVFMAGYRHTQFGWVTVISTGVIGVFVTLLLLQGQLLVPAIVTATLIALTLLLFGWLNVSVGDDTLDVRFGIGLVRKRIELSNVRAYRSVKNPWYWGWGIRMYPGGWLYNVSGLDAVELVLRDGKELRVGTDEPEELEQALRHALGESAPFSPEEHRTRVKRTRRWQLVILGLALLVVLGVGGVVYADTRPPRVSVDGAEFHVQSAMYGMDIPFADIESVSLESELPRILARTNGTGAGRTLRGHFRLERLGDGELFLEYGSAPYLFVRTHDSFVYVGYSDPARTRQVHAELTAALAARGRVL